MVGQEYVRGFVDGFRSFEAQRPAGRRPKSTGLMVAVFDEAATAPATEFAAAVMAPSVDATRTMVALHATCCASSRGAWQ